MSAMETFEYFLTEQMNCQNVTNKAVDDSAIGLYFVYDLKASFPLGN